jgi:hypothetical protein
MRGIQNKEPKMRSVTLLARISHTTDGCAACKRIWIAFGAGRGKSVALEGAIFS